jgi:uncharacterized protein (DUF983 family)
MLLNSVAIKCSIVTLLSLGNLLGLSVVLWQHVVVRGPLVALLVLDTKVDGHAGGQDSRHGDC